MEKYEICVEVAGPTAMWTRPDCGDCPVSYPAPTYSAVKGIFEAILFNQAVEVVPHKVEICAPIVYHAYNTNYGGPLRKPGVIKRGGSYQLLATVVINPCYRIYAALKLSSCDSGVLSTATKTWKGRTTNPLHAFQEIFIRRVKRGQSFTIPFLGWKEFTVDYVGEFRDETHAQEDINLRITSMLRQTFPHGLGSHLEYVYDQNVTVIKGVLMYPERSDHHA